MKDQKKIKAPQTEKAFGLEFTLNESLSKYLDPEYASDKLKKAELKFSKQAVHQ
jgi:hypothetical protein